MKTHHLHSHAAKHAQSLTVIAQRAQHQLGAAMHDPAAHLGAVLNVSLIAVSIAIILWLAFKALSIIGCALLDLGDPGVRGSGGHNHSDIGTMVARVAFCASMGLVSAAFMSMATGAGPLAIHHAIGG